MEALCFAYLKVVENYAEVYVVQREPKGAVHFERAMEEERVGLFKCGK